MGSSVLVRWTNPPVSRGCVEEGNGKPLPLICQKNAMDKDSQPSQDMVQENGTPRLKGTMPVHYSCTLYLYIIPVHDTYTLYLYIIPVHYAYTLYLYTNYLYTIYLYTIPAHYGCTLCLYVYYTGTLCYAYMVPACALHLQDKSGFLRTCPCLY